jgi:hypothetical protein
MIQDCGAVHQWAASCVTEGDGMSTVTSEQLDVYRERIKALGGYL